jgi:hypothetical protein
MTGYRFTKRDDWLSWEPIDGFTRSGVETGVRRTDGRWKRFWNG